MGEPAEWEAHTLPRVTPSMWTSAEARAGIRTIERLQAQLDLARAQLVGVLRAATGRDTRAALVRETGMSAADARRAEAVSKVVESVPGAAPALRSGEVRGGHLALLAPVADSDQASALLELASAQSVDEFARTVERHRIEADAAGHEERQRRARSVRFFRAEEGCVGIRAVLPTIEGRQVQATIEALCDRQWREAHPDRADVAGGHGGEPRERRLADALVEVVTGAPPASADLPDHTRDHTLDHEPNDGSDRVTAPPPHSTPDRAAGDEPGSRSASRSGTMPVPATADGRPRAARIGVIVVLDEARMTAHLAGTGDPVPLTRLAALVADVRTELYTAVRSVRGSILHFGRARRHATLLQKLALIARDGGRCLVPGCDQPWDRCDADHVVDWDRGGRTDIDNLRLLCRTLHHPHRHDTGIDPEQPDEPVGHAA